MRRWGLSGLADDSRVGGMHCLMRYDMMMNWAGKSTNKRIAILATTGLGTDLYVSYANILFIGHKIGMSFHCQHS